MARTAGNRDLGGPWATTDRWQPGDATSRCVGCGGKVGCWTGHILRDGKKVVAGWCNVHGKCDERPDIICDSNGRAYQWGTQRFIGASGHTKPRSIQAGRSEDAKKKSERGRKKERR